jgi:hypothetical protein
MADRKRKEPSTSAGLDNTADDPYCIDDTTLVAIGRSLILRMNDAIVCYMRTYNLLRHYVGSQPHGGTIRSGDVRRLGGLVKAVMTNCVILRERVVATPSGSLKVLFTRKYVKGERGAHRRGLVPPKRAERQTAAVTLSPLYENGQLLAANESRHATATLPTVADELLQRATCGIGPFTKDILSEGSDCVALIVAAAETLMRFSLTGETLKALQTVIRSSDEFVSLATTAVNGITE